MRSKSVPIQRLQCAGAKMRGIINGNAAPKFFNQGVGGRLCPNIGFASLNFFSDYAPHCKKNSGHLIELASCFLYSRSFL